MPVLPAAKRWPNWKPARSSRWLRLPVPSHTDPGLRRGRLYDFRPPPQPKPERRIREPWRLAMKIKLESEEGKARYKKRKQTVEPVFGIIKSAIGFTRFHLRSRDKLSTERLVVALAYNCRRLCRLRTA